MVAWPTTGGSEGTWNDEMKAFVDVEHNADGTHNIFDINGGYSTVDVDNTKTKVYTKYLTGTLDADSVTSVAHSVTATNILAVSVIVYEDNNSTYQVSEYRMGVGTSLAYLVGYDATNIIISSVGTYLQGNAYRIKIDFIL